MDSKRWTTVSDSEHDHEREALAWLRPRLPDRDPYRVWTNFSFVTRHGQMDEVDALAVTDSGIYLIEVNRTRARWAATSRPGSGARPMAGSSSSTTRACSPSARPRR